MPYKSQAGQTLLETVVAVGVIAIGLGSLIALFTAVNMAGRQSTKQVLAANFAREGIEAVRILRDSNWLAGSEWDQGLSDDFDFTGVPILNTDDYHWQIDFTPENFTDRQTIIYQNNEGLFLQLTESPTGDEADSGYQRLLTLTPEPGQYLEVICEVRWIEQSQTHSYQLAEKIYDWKNY